jgi:hypothetical protein
MTNFQLVGAQFTNTPTTIYRLQYQILPFSALPPLIEDLYVQLLTTNSFQLIDSNYSATASPAFSQLQPSAILTDVWLTAINTLIINSYSNLIGSSPAIVGIASAPPYYQFEY